MKDIFITGCNRGAGRGLAEYFIEKGFRVHGINRTSAHWEHEYYDEIIWSGDSIDELRNQLGNASIDVLILNVGAYFPGELSSQPYGDWEQSYEANVNHPFKVMQAAHEHLISSRALVFFMGTNYVGSSLSGLGAYTSSKSALKSLSDVARTELQPHGVRVTYIGLGGISSLSPNRDWTLNPTDVGELLLAIIALPVNTLVPTLEYRSQKEIW